MRRILAALAASVVATMGFSSPAHATVFDTVYHWCDAKAPDGTVVRDVLQISGNPRSSASGASATWEYDHLYLASNRGTAAEGSWTITTHRWSSADGSQYSRGPGGSMNPRTYTSVWTPGTWYTWDGSRSRWGYVTVSGYKDSRPGMTLINCTFDLSP